MAVVPRKRARGVITYFVATSWEGGQHWERVGHNKREAQALDAQRRKEVKEGTFRPGRLTDASSVESYAKAWLLTRTNRSRDTDEQLMRDHVLSVRSFAELRMGDVRPRHVLQLITDIRAVGRLGEKSISLVLGLVRVMFRDAVIDDTISATPYVVPRGKLSRAGKTRTPYTPAEVAALTSDAVAERDRMWATIAFYTGMRCGEVCGLRWGDLDTDPEPLWALTVARQYDGAVTKTGRSRVVPVHPVLVAELLTWRARWSTWFLRRPTDADPIVPALDGTSMTKSSAYKGWRRACKAAGVTNRTVHSSRHTFITLTRRGGADIGIVELITHNPAGKIIDVYNHRDWGDFCSAVLCLSVALKTPGPSGSSSSFGSEAGPADGSAAVVPGGGESGTLSQSLSRCSPDTEIASSSAWTRTVATAGTPGLFRSDRELREQVALRGAAGLLGVRAPLGASQDQNDCGEREARIGLITRLHAGATPAPATTSGPAAEGFSSRRPDGEVTGQLGPRGMVPGERPVPGVCFVPPHETPRGSGFSRAALALFAEACALGVA